jgi:hypothetical protein
VKKEQRNLSNRELADLVNRVDGFLASSGVSQEESNYLVNNALELTEAWVDNPEEMDCGFVLADWLLDQDKVTLSHRIREVAAVRGSMGTGTA